MASIMLDLPEPFSPVTQLNWGSRAESSVRAGYDLNPSRII
jgi:hypothetical protein